MAVRTDTPRPNGSGSSAPAAGFDAPVAAEAGDRLEAPPPIHRDAVAALTHRLHRLDQEAHDARQRGEQLEATLAKRTRRMQQLIGERDQLASLLAARDADLLRLTRELGALGERAAAPTRRTPALLAAANALLDRLPYRRKAPSRAGPVASETAHEASGERPLRPWIMHEPPKSVLGVVVFGLSEAEIENVLGIVERHCRERELAPLLLTDNDAFELFRGRRVLFEFLPARAEREQFAAELDWRLYTLRRLALIRRKWRPVRVIAFGRSATEVLQMWRESPFEATPLPASLKDRAEGPEPDWGTIPQPVAVQP